MSTWRPAPGDNDPRPVSESLDRLTRRMGTPAAAVMSTVFSRWEEIVGPDLAAHARPESLRSGVLVLVAEDPAWAVQLRFMESDIRARIVAASGTSDVSEVRVRVRRL